MTRPGPAQLGAATQFLARAKEARGGGDDAQAAERACERIYQQMAPILGPAGIDALLARSAALIKADFPCLEGFAPARGADPAPRCLHACLRGQEPAVAAEAAEAFLATFFGLLTGLIGDWLTAQLLQGAWPEGGEPSPGERKK